jgi:hypothetical protein
MGIPGHPPADDFDFDPSDPAAAILARTKLLSNVKEFAASAWLSSQAKRDFKETRLVAANSASAAVLLAWRAVEGILRDISFYLDVHRAGTSASAPLRQNSRQIMKSLYKRELIDSDAFDRYFDLVRLRNSVAHAEHFSASTEDVREYNDRAQELGGMLARVLSKVAGRAVARRAGVQKSRRVLDGPGPAGRTARRLVRARLRGRRSAHGHIGCHQPPLWPRHRRPGGHGVARGSGLGHAPAPLVAPLHNLGVGSAARPLLIATSYST